MVRVNESMIGRGGERMKQRQVKVREKRKVKIRTSEQME